MLPSNKADIMVETFDRTVEELKFRCCLTNLDGKY